MVAGHPNAVVKALTDFGHHYGLAFQIVDDLLDVMATDKELGKPAGNDLIEGVYTLPIIRALNGPNGNKIRELLEYPVDTNTRDLVLNLLRDDKAIATTVTTAQEFILRAREALQEIQMTPAIKTLLATCDLLTNRISTFTK